MVTPTIEHDWKWIWKRETSVRVVAFWFTRFVWIKIYLLRWVLSYYLLLAYCCSLVSHVDLYATFNSVSFWTLCYRENIFFSSCERCHNIRSSGTEDSNERVSRKVDIFECFWCKEMDTQVRGYLEKLRFLSAFGVTRRIPKWEGILKSWDFLVLLV